MPRRKLLKAVAHNLLDSLLSGPSGRFDGSLFDHLEAAAVSADVPAIELDIMGQCVRPERASTGGTRMKRRSLGCWAGWSGSSLG